EVDHAAQLALRFEEVDGGLDIGVEPVDLESALARIDVVTGPAPPRPTSRIEDDPAEHPGLPDGLAIRPDDLAFHRHAAAEHQVDFLAACARLQVEQAVGVRVDPVAARLTLLNHPRADGLEHVIVAGALDEEATRARRGSELK